MRTFPTALLQLLRLPNVWTAAADSLAGWLLAGGTLAEPAHWLPLVAASMVLYTSGVVLNDVIDVETDRRERPMRPIPSGHVSPGLATVLGVIGLVLGPLFALASGSLTSLLIALILVAVILAYNGGLKATVLGPELMGTCRALNLLLGMSHTAFLGGPVAWLAAMAYGLFVAGITWISRMEAGTGESRYFHVGLVLQNLAMVGLLAAAFQPRKFPHPPLSRPIIPIEGLLVLLLVALLVNVAATRVIYRPVPALIQKAVKTGILTLVWIDVGLVAAVRGPCAAAAVAALWLPAYLLSRWLYCT
jgi:4-hydroxybenzoate polyprenyltransferase